MNAEEFIHVIKWVVRDAAIINTIDVLARPPGRRPSQELLDQAKWYKSLSGQERSLLADVLAQAVDDAVFGFLCVIDGVRVVEDGPIKGQFQLSYVKDKPEIVNPPDIMLHELYNS
jgi:hypothetical protein